jgi:hypothetical protein
LAFYKNLLDKQTQGIVLDLSKVIRPGLVKLATQNGVVNAAVLQGSGRLEKTPAGVFVDAFIPSDQLSLLKSFSEQHPGAVVMPDVSMPFSREFVETTNLLSSRGSAGANSDMLGAILTTSSYFRVKIRADKLTAPFSDNAAEVNNLLKKIESYPASIKNKINKQMALDDFSSMSINEKLNYLKVKLATVGETNQEGGLFGAVKSVMGTLPKAFFKDKNSQRP